VPVTTVSHPAVRWTVAIFGGLGVAILVGGLATLGGSGDVDEMRRFVAFALATGPAAVVLLAMLGQGAPDRVEHEEDTVEHAWTQQAGFGAFCDLLLALGVTLTATSVLDLPQVPLVLFVLLAMVDFPVRYAVLARRG
jgi:hypothetical protein